MVADGVVTPSGLDQKLVERTVEIAKLRGGFGSGTYLGSRRALATETSLVI